MNEHEENDCVVTVYCPAYNHALFIKDALEGFVNQKTNFKYQVIVHDDASTDGTQDIIKTYEAKYPGIIRGIYQQENQHSRGVSIFKEFVVPLIKGRYVATCEGDDYWIDENKLQKQFDILEENPTLVACVHNTVYWNQKNGKKKVFYSKKYRGVLPFIKCISRGGGAFHTSSLFMKTEYSITPCQMTIKGIGDYPRAVYLALSGDIFYLNDVMSVYRQYATGSWSNSQTEESMITNILSSIRMLREADKLSNYKHHIDFLKAIRTQEFSLLIRKEEWRQALKEYPDVISDLPLRRKTKLYLHACFPGLYDALKRKRSRR